MKRRIGIMGGTFNPIHNGHIQMALCAREQYQLDQVWFIPAGRPPHKQGNDYGNPWLRMEMASLALEPYPDFFVKDFEILRPGPSFTYETLEQLQKEYPQDHYYFIIGEDSLFTFLSWREPERICRCADILVAGRQGEFRYSENNDFHREIARCRQRTGGDFSVISMENIAISSSDIRAAMKMGEDVSDMLPHNVEIYINQHHLYREAYDDDFLHGLEKEMKKTLTSGRYRHTIGVMHTAGTLAMRYGYPMGNAMAAGLLHDCAKCLSDEKKMHICRKEGIPLRPIEKSYPHLLHGKVGACLAKKEYGIKDPDILHAIEVHTTGCPGMNLLDEILFVADYIEPGRTKAPNLEEVRYLAFYDLHKCVYRILQDTVSYLASRPEEADEATTDTLAYYKKKYQKEGRSHDKQQRTCENDM